MTKLIAFYSRADENYFGGAMKIIKEGNTEKAANILAELTGADLFKIEQKVPDYAVAVGNPARVIKMLDKEKFENT